MSNAAPVRSSVATDQKVNGKGGKAHDDEERKRKRELDDHINEFDAARIKCLEDLTLHNERLVGSLSKQRETIRGLTHRLDYKTELNKKLLDTNANLRTEIVKISNFQEELLQIEVKDKAKIKELKAKLDAYEGKPLAIKEEPIDGTQDVPIDLD